MNLVDFIFPKTCIACKSFIDNKEIYVLCQTCRSKIKYVQSPICTKCGMPLYKATEYCKNCIDRIEKIPYEFLRGVCIYDFPINECIHQLKYSNKEYISNFLADILYEYILKNPELKTVDFVVPVPLHWWRKLKRGYNQSELIAKIIATKLNLGFNTGNLYRKKYTKPQINLKREMRLKNVKDAFGIKNREIFRNKSVLLIDDVCTTGSTIENCAIELKHAGAKKIYGLTVARD